MPVFVRDFWGNLLVAGVLGFVIGWRAYEAWRLRRLNGMLLALCIEGQRNKAHRQHLGPVGFSIEIKQQSLAEMMQAD